jgi:hypothetical protein
MKSRHLPALHSINMPRREKDDRDTPDQERERREAEELESFGRRADWLREHYGVPPEEADERTQKAIEQAEEMSGSDEADDPER